MKKRIVTFKVFLPYAERVAEAMRIAAYKHGFQRVMLKTMIVRDFEIELIWNPALAETQNPQPGAATGLQTY